MIYSTATVPVNSEGETRLTRAQAWRGLELKARDAREFLPSGLCTRCDVVEESPTHLVREATIGGAGLSRILARSPPRHSALLPASRASAGPPTQHTVHGQRRALP